MTIFHKLDAAPEDALHGVMARYAADTRTEKMDLGVGVYRDATGASPIMEAIARSQAALLSEETSKSYLGLRGDESFLDGMTALLFPDGIKFLNSIASVQTVGGTGGIWLALQLAVMANPELTVHIGVPTWPNHISICSLNEIKYETYPYFDQKDQRLDYEAMVVALQKAGKGDVFIFHGPCHNPSGVDLSRDQFLELLSLCAQRGVIPLIDAAYYGLGNGLDEDLAGIKEALLICPESFLVMSCSKSFGLYRERVGILFASMENAAAASRVLGQMERIGRATYSMPPSHGAASVAGVLSDPELTRLWRTELGEMRMRLIGVRTELADYAREASALGEVKAQKGIFSLLPISGEHVDQLERSHGIYMPRSGRINLAGFKTGDVQRFVAALRDVLSTNV